MYKSEPRTEVHKVHTSLPTQNLDTDESIQRVDSCNM